MGREDFLTKKKKLTGSKDSNTGHWCVWITILNDLNYKLFIPSFIYFKRLRMV